MAYNGAGQRVAGILAAAITVGTAVFASHTRFVVVEERQANHVRKLVDLTEATDRLASRLSALERDPRTIERLHAIELRLGAIEQILQRRPRR